MTVHGRRRKKRDKRTKSGVNKLSGLRAERKIILKKKEEAK